MPQHPTHRYFLWLALLLVVFIVLAYIFRLSFSGPAQPVVPASTGDFSAQAAFPADAPAPKPADYVTAQQGFQYLVSYTANGFVPKTLGVKKGETVRFTNNSNTTLQLSLSGATSLAHAEYFEYTFTKSATVTDGTAAHTGTVTVK